MPQEEGGEWRRHENRFYRSSNQPAHNASRSSRRHPRVLHRRGAQRSTRSSPRNSKRRTGHKLITHFGLPSELVEKARRRRAGRRDHPVLRHRRLVKQGKIVAGSRTVLGRTGVGVAIPQGAPKPDVQQCRCVQAFPARRQVHRDVGRRQQRAAMCSRCSTGSASPTRSSRRSSPARPAGGEAAGRQGGRLRGDRPAAGCRRCRASNGSAICRTNSTAGCRSPAGSTSPRRNPKRRALLKFLVTPAAAAVFKTKGLEPRDSS